MLKFERKKSVAKRLRRGSAAACLLGLRVRIPPGVRISVSGECYVCCQVEVSEKGRSLVQSSPTECGMSECDRGTPQTRPTPTRDGCTMRKKKKRHQTFQATRILKTQLFWELTPCRLDEQFPMLGRTGVLKSWPWKWWYYDSSKRWQLLARTTRRYIPELP